MNEKNAETVTERVKPTKLKIEVNAGDDDMLFTTIPVEKGWTVKVDGVETEYVEVLDALIGVPLAEGRHTIEMSFTTAGYPMAVIITVSGAVVFIALIAISRIITAKKSKKASLETDDEADSEEEQDEEEE
ncbi:MAG: YfhO family protein [Ruminiclostridium sp.]|nr:YfhO family protein [Ruminiclostridium sp.]